MVGNVAKFKISSFVSLFIYSLSGQAGSLDNLKNLSLEDFSNLDVVVTSLFRRPQKITESAAAVFVISNEDIKHSGVMSLPEALR